MIDHQHVFNQRFAIDRTAGAKRTFRVSLLFRQMMEQHLLNQRRFARARDAGDHHQSLQRQLKIDVLEVVLAGAANLQLGLIRPRWLRIARLGDLTAAGQKIPRERSRRLHQGRRCTLEHQLAAAFTRPGADIQDLVSGAHHLWIMLDDQQRVAGIAQALEDAHHPIHIARMQANAGLIEHEERVDQGRAERGGEIDALYLATREGPRLALQGQIAEPDLGQILQPGADVQQQQIHRLIETAG